MRKETKKFLARFKNKWTHIAIVKSGNKFEIFEDGKKQNRFCVDFWVKMKRNPKGLR